MRDVDGRAPDPAMDLLQLRAHRHAERRVEVRERLVEEQQRGLANERTRERDPLALAARELVRAPCEEVDAPHELGCGPNAPFGLARRHVANRQPEADVLLDRQVWEERVALEDHRDVSATGPPARHVALAEQDPSGARLLQPGDQPEERRLAAARRADHGEQLALGDLEIERRECLDFAVALCETLETESAQGVSPRANSGRVARSSRSATSEAG